MSFEFTMLLTLICFFLSKFSTRFIKCSPGAFKFTVLSSMAICMTAPILIDLQNPNAGLAGMVGLLLAFCLPSGIMFLCRCFKLFVRFIQRIVNGCLFRMGRQPWVITWI